MKRMWRGDNRDEKKVNYIAYPIAMWTVMLLLYSKFIYKCDIYLYPKYSLTNTTLSVTEKPLCQYFNSGIVVFNLSKKVCYLEDMG